MPNRPPNQWWTRAVRSIAQNPEVTDPERLAGWVWAHWMSPQAKAEAVKGEFDPRPVEQALKVLAEEGINSVRTLRPTIPNRIQARIQGEHLQTLPNIRPKQSLYPEVRGGGLKAALYPPEQRRLTPRERVEYHGYAGQPAMSKSAALISETPKTSRRRPTRVSYHYYHHYPGEKASPEEENLWQGVQEPNRSHTLRRSTFPR